MITASLLDVRQHGERPLGHVVLTRLRVHLAQQATLAIEALEGFRLRPVDLDPAAHRHLVAVGPALHLVATGITDALLRRWFELEVIGALAVGACPARREPADG